MKLWKRKTTMTTMTWNDFIEKIVVFRKETGKSNLSAPAVMRLLYSGAFDEMLDAETMKIPAMDRYAQLLKQVMQAIGSKAQLPKASKIELIGLNQVTKIEQLMLWRFSSNPFVQYNMADFCKSFLKSQGFERPQLPEGDILWVKPARSGHKLRIDVRYSWQNLFKSPKLLENYENNRLVGSICIITKVEKRLFQGNKESLVISMFNGHEYIEGIRMWPDKSGVLNPLVTSQIKKHAVGLAVLRPKPWNDKPGGSFIEWVEVLGVT